MVEEIEELGSELGAISFLEFPHLRDREIHVSIVWTGEDSPARVTDGSVSGRSQNASILYVASSICERSKGELAVCSGGTAVRSCCGILASCLYRCARIACACIGSAASEDAVTGNGIWTSTAERRARSGVIPVLGYASSDRAIIFLAGSEPVS